MDFFELMGSFELIARLLHLDRARHARGPAREWKSLSLLGPARGVTTALTLAGAPAARSAHAISRQEERSHDCEPPGEDCAARSPDRRGRCLRRRRQDSRRGPGDRGPDRAGQADLTRRLTV